MTANPGEETLYVVANLRKGTTSTTQPAYALGAFRSKSHAEMVQALAGGASTKAIPRTIALSDAQAGASKEGVLYLALDTLNGDRGDFDEPVVRLAALSPEAVEAQVPSLPWASILVRDSVVIDRLPDFLLKDLRGLLDAHEAAVAHACP
jgi:hypothetical protein